MIESRIEEELRVAWQQALPSAYRDGMAFIKVTYDKDHTLHIKAATPLDLDRLIAELQAIKHDHENLPLFLTET